MLRYVMALVYQWRASSDSRRTATAPWSWCDPGSGRIRESAPASPYCLERPRHGVAGDDAGVHGAHACPRPPWLDDAIRLHGARPCRSSATTAAPATTRLNQSIGLLDVGCYLERTDWQALAVRRIDTLLTFAPSTARASPTSRRPATTATTTTASCWPASTCSMCGLRAAGRIRARRAHPRFLAQATRPDGHYETIGDYGRLPGRAPSRARPSEFSASAGARGARARPHHRDLTAGIRVRAGPAGVRTAPFGDETFFSLRFGPGLLASRSRRRRCADPVRLRVASSWSIPGYGDQNSSIWRPYFVSRAAHNVVTVDWLRRSAGNGATACSGATSRHRAAEWLVRVRAYPGVTHATAGHVLAEAGLPHRRGHHERERGPDATASCGTSPRMPSQSTDGARTMTRRDRGNLLIGSSSAAAPRRIVTGRTVAHPGLVLGRSYGDQQRQRRSSSTGSRASRCASSRCWCPSGRTGTTDRRCTSTDLRLTSHGLPVTVEHRRQPRARPRRPSTSVTITDRP